jgi:hypothetical protein
LIRLTNAERGDLIDALELASEFAQSMINSHLPSRRQDWTQDDRDNFAEWTGQVKRQVAAGRELRHVFTAEEVEYIIPLSFHDLLNCAEIAKQLNALK